MNCEDWVYVAEGGMHVLFSYQVTPGHTSYDTKFSGKMLRLRKCDLFHKESHENEGEKYNPVNWYMKNVVAPKIEPFVDLPEVIELTWSFVDQLRKNTIDGGFIPEARLKDWNVGESAASIENSDAIVSAALLRNYALMPPSQSCFAVEFKPKAGYISSSPLVHPQNRGKYRRSRFKILQYLHYHGFITKGWSSSKSDEISKYDPLDLFSGDKTRVHLALEHLFECPQNNLKVTYSNKCSTLLYGYQASSDLHGIALKNVFGVNEYENSESKLATEIKKTLEFILESEDFLNKLVEVQKLDWIDADGAVLIYNRLVDICNGSQEDAEKIIDSPSTLTGKDDTPVHKDFSSSPFSDKLVSEKVIDLMNLMDIIQSLLEESPELTSKSKELLDKYHEEANSIVSELGVDDCKYLLQNWMLSLAMCDVSFFVTFSTEFDETSGKNQQTESFQVVKPQSCDYDGVASTPSGLKLNYTIKIVDWDRKPAKKLRKRYSTEDALKNFQD